MGVVTAPLFSLTASGTIGKALTYSRWKGIKYVRTRVVPQNPNSTAQQEVRGAFTYLQAEYGRFDATAQQVWDTYSRGKPFTGRNAWTALNNEAIRQAGDLSTLVMFPGQSPIPPPNGATATGGAGQIAITVPDGPTLTNWTALAAWAIAVPDQDPYTPPFLLGTYSNGDFSTPYSFNITAVPAGDYRVFAAYQYSSTADPNITRFGPQEDLGTETVT